MNISPMVNSVMCTVLTRVRG